MSYRVLFDKINSQIRFCFTFLLFISLVIMIILTTNQNILGICYTFYPNYLPHPIYKYGNCYINWFQNILSIFTTY